MSGVNDGSDRELGDFQSLVLAGRGLAHLSYARSKDGVADTQLRIPGRSADRSPCEARQVVASGSRYAR